MKKLSGFGKGNTSKNDEYKQMAGWLAKEVNQDQRDKIFAGLNILGRLREIGFEILRGYPFNKQLSDDEVKLVLAIVMLGINDAVFEKIDVKPEIKSISFLLAIADKHLVAIADEYNDSADSMNLFNYSIDDAQSIFEKISNISSQDWVEHLFLEGKKTWKIIAEKKFDESSMYLPLSDIFKNSELVLKVKQI